MPNLMQEGVAWLANQLQQHAGRRVRVSTCNTTRTITCWVSDKVYTVVDNMGVAIDIKSRDFTYKSADLRGDLCVGDTFTETIGTKTYTHEVMPLSDEPTTAWADVDGQMIIAHTKRVQIR